MMKTLSRRPGRVITFYSYKGGTGRSMALANVAWVLAGAGKRVLVIDWDLEAPGLHRYFAPFLIDRELGASDGLIDLIDRYACAAIAPPPAGEPLPADWWHELTDFSEHVLGVAFDGFPSGGGIDLLPAGRQGPTYAAKVSAFNWQNFFDRLGGGGFLDALRERARREYDYVLIDSRTGVSDTAGICTAQMPDTLVVCFTYNNQSIKGAAAVAASALQLQEGLAEQRRRAAASTGSDGSIDDSPLPFRVYPVAMRVDAGESERLAVRQTFARETFAPLVTHIGDPAAYWAAVEVPYRVFYAYEEVLAPLKDDAFDPKTVLAAFVRLAGEITGGAVGDYRLRLAPEVRQRLLDAFAETPQTEARRRADEAAARETENEALTRRIETALLGLDEAARVHARSIAGRLVRLVRDDEGGGTIPIRVALAEFEPQQREVLATLASAGLLSVGTELRPQGSGPASPEQTVAWGHERAFELSPTLREWLAKDREFLLWRQQLRAYRTDWARSGDRGALLSGGPLAEARVAARSHPQDLNEAERQFIEASIAAAEATLVATQTMADVPLRAEMMEPVPTTQGPPVPRTAPAPFAPPQPPPHWPESPRAARPEPTGTGAAPRASYAERPAYEPARQAPAGRRWGSMAVAGLIVVLAPVVLFWGFMPSPSSLPSADPAGSAPGPINPTPTPIPPDPARLAELRFEADTLYEQGKPDAAEAAYQRLLALDPTQVHALLQLGRIHDQNGNFAAAAAQYQRAIDLEPKAARPRIERAASLISQRRYDEALADLNAALEIDPNSDLAYLNRGVVHENLGRADAAIADYGAAIRLNQNNAPAYLRRAALTEKSNPAAARADYQTVLRSSAPAALIQTAEQRLAALGKTPTVVSPKQANSDRGRVFIQYSDAADVATVTAIGRALQGMLKGVEVATPEKVAVRGEGEVRYFFPADRALAQSVSDAAELQLAKQARPRPLRATYRDAKAYPNATPGTVELWLPSLTDAPATRGLRPLQSTSPPNYTVPPTVKER
jgi:tetratricopeptide (TPR) repeat protein/MinD-like ATPase involved in chromosome partitioning or flagellar assembly